MKIGENEDLGCVHRESEAFPVAGTLTYGECVIGRVPQGMASVWKFSGSANDHLDIIVEPVDNELDPMIDVQDADEKSVLSPETPDYPLITGYIYIVVIGLAVLMGYWSILHRKETQTDS